MKRRVMGGSRKRRCQRYDPNRRTFMAAILQLLISLVFDTIFTGLIQLVITALQGGSATGA